jgi:hypothetical protein
MSRDRDPWLSDNEPQHHGTTLQDRVNSLYVIRGKITKKKKWKSTRSLLSPGERMSAAGAGVGAAVAGSAAGAVGAMQTLGAKDREVEYFKAYIGDVPVTGWFNIANFKSGDIVEAVVSKLPPCVDGHECVAILRTEDNILWTVGGGLGKKANRQSRLKGSAILAGVVFFLVMILNFFTSRDAIDFFESAVMLGLACFGLFLMFYFTKPEVAKVVGALEEKALPLLGFKDADWLYLGKGMQRRVFIEREGSDYKIQGAYDVSGLERGGHEVVDVVMPKKPRSRVKPEDPNTLNDEADDDVDDGDDQASDDTVRRA